jgi:membrane-associated protein
MRSRATGTIETGLFLSFNVFGGLIWVVSMTLIGYYLGQFAWVTKNIEIVIVIVVFVSILPGLIAAAREWLKTRRTAAV